MHCHSVYCAKDLAGSWSVPNEDSDKTIMLCFTSLLLANVSFSMMQGVKDIVCHHLDWDMYPCLKVFVWMLHKLTPDVEDLALVG